METLEVKEPVDLTETAKFGSGVSAEVGSIEAVTGEAKVQGEIAGPALRVGVTVTNGSKKRISLATTQVEVTYGKDRTPGVQLSGPDVEPFPASLAPGKEATGYVVFGVPLDQRDLIQISVLFSTEAPILVFEGSAASS